MVNDVLYEIFYLEGQSTLIPEIDDSWVHVGKVESRVQGVRPSENFQASSESEIVGADVYHSDTGRIILSPRAGFPPNDFVRMDEIFVDSIIVDYRGQRTMYIAKDLVNEVHRQFQSVDPDIGVLLHVNGELHRAGAYWEGGDFRLEDDYIYIGVILSTVPENERPTEDFQVNNTLYPLIGAKVYMASSNIDPELRREIVVPLGDDEWQFYTKVNRSG